MSRTQSPFSARAVLALVVGGALLFLAMLWLIGTGLGHDRTNRGEATVGGKGLNGYAALADYLERRGFDITRARTANALQQPGLVVLTPPADADGAELTRIVDARRYIGPTLIIAPKWLAAPITDAEDLVRAKAKPGWVQLAGVNPPEWPGFYDNLAVEVTRSKSGRWLAPAMAEGISARLPDPAQVLSGKGEGLIPLVVSEGDGRILAGFIDDAGDYPGVQSIAAADIDWASPDDADLDLYPVAFVFEPDLVNNWGMANAANARMAERLVRALDDGQHRTVAFDLTLNGFGRSQNLLTLAFAPPFLAATLCLLLAALILGWRAFLRFGPPLAEGQALAFGKTALVGNAAALLRRAKRLHLAGAPYADAARERIACGLALPGRLDAAATEAAIDRALAARDATAEPFSRAAATMRAARRPADLLRAAQALHALERILIR